MTIAFDWRVALRLGALALLGASLAVPSVSLTRAVYDVVAILDITGSMNTQDQILDGAPASRIAVEKQAMHRLLAQLPCGSKFGLGIFVEKQPFLFFQPVETCANFSALDTEISAIDWRMGWDSESHIADALLASIRIAATQNADLAFFTDGQESPPLWWTGMPNFAPARGSVRGLIEGVGGTQLVPIPRYDSNGRQIGFFRPSDLPDDPDGTFAGHANLSAVDEPHLRQLATLSGLSYRHFAAGGDVLSDMRGIIRPRAHPGRFTISWVFASLALAALAAAHVPVLPWNVPLWSRRIMTGHGSPSPGRSRCAGSRVSSSGA